VVELPALEAERRWSERVTMRKLVMRVFLASSILVSFAGTSAHTARALPAPDDLRIVTVPSVAGAVFEFDQHEYTTASDGSVTIPDAGDLSDLGARLVYRRFDGDEAEAVEFHRFHGLERANGSREVTGVFTTSRAVSFQFTDLDGAAVDADTVERMTLKNAVGVVFTLGPGDFDGYMLPAVRVIQRTTGLETKEIYYSIQDVVINGTNTVNRSQQRFFASEVDRFDVETQFFHVVIEVSDVLLGFTSGTAVLVRWPNGVETRHPVIDGAAELPLLPRGDYEMRVDGPGMVTWRPVSVSRDQVLALELLSVIDMSAVGIAVLLIAVGLVIFGRRRHRSHVRAASQSPVTGSAGVDAESPVPVRGGRS
jgi:hypothetical protein